MLNIRPEIKVSGLRVKVTMPVLSMPAVGRGYVIRLQVFGPNLFTVNQTGFLALALTLTL